MLTSLFAAVDAWLGFVPVLLRVAGWGAAGGALTMGLYGLLSPQTRLRALKDDAAAARAAMGVYDGDDIGEMLSLTRRALGLSVQQIGLVCIPTLIAAAPLVALAAWIGNAYGHAAPAPGTSVAAHIVPAHTKAEHEAAETTQLTWPAAGGHVTLTSQSSDTPLLAIPADFHRATITTRRWWHVFVAAKPYLAADAAAASVQFDLPARELLAFGPTWVRTWHLPFFLGVGVAAVAVKIAAGIA